MRAAAFVGFGRRITFNAETYAVLGNAYDNNGQFEEALDCYLDRSGASAPYKTIYENPGITAAAMADAAELLVR